MANTTFSSTIRSKSGFKVINESSTTGAITETGFSVNSTGQLISLGTRKIQTFAVSLADTNAADTTYADNDVLVEIGELNTDHPDALVTASKFFIHKVVLGITTAAASDANSLANLQLSATSGTATNTAISAGTAIVGAGGASVGDEDHLIKVLSELGKVYFWRAAIKPGRPIAVGKINKCFVICLPGNPVSVQLLYAMLVKPLIEKLSGGNFKLPSSSKITANFSMKKKTKRMEWLRVNKETINNKNIANKFPKQGSGMISSISYSDGIIEIDENVSQVKKGDIFDFYNYESLF